MNKRKLLIGLSSAAVLTGAFGGTVVDASADQVWQVTLTNGQVVRVTVAEGQSLPSVYAGLPATLVGTTPAPAPAAAPATPQKQPAQNSATTSTPTSTAPSKQQPTSTTPSATAKPKATTTPKAAPTTTSTAKPKPKPKADQQAQQPAVVPSDRPGETGTPKAQPKATPKHHQKTTGAQPAKPKVKKKKKTAKHKPAPADTAPAAPPATPAPPAPASAAPAATPAPAPAPVTPSDLLAQTSPIGVPNFFIDKFRIPPFLLPIYQAAGIQYGVRWEVLAAINEIETDYGRNLNVSTAGAIGWMQFMPSTWELYGVDGNNDGRRDPYNPVDAIFAAARYLKAAGAEQDLRQAIFAYNHADWYVDSVLLRARLIAGLPTGLIGSLTGLTQGHFPVFAKTRYADDITPADAQQPVAVGSNAAVPVESSSTRRGIDIHAKAGSPVVATQDGKIVRMGVHPRLGRFIMLRDVYGNTYTYGHLKKLAEAYPVPKEKTVSASKIADELKLPNDPKPEKPATAGRQTHPAHHAAKAAAPKPAPAPAAQAVDGKERLFAHPQRPAAYAAGGKEQLAKLDGQRAVGDRSFRSYFTQLYGLKKDDVVLKPLKVGSQVIAGTILGRLGKLEPQGSPYVRFEIRPAGRGAPRIDPKPILDGWKLLESTAVYRAAGLNPFFGANAQTPSVGQVLMMSKEALQRRVLADPNVEIYACGRRDIEAGIIDRRVLATIEFLSVSGLKPTISALECGHSYLTASGNVSEHSSGNAVDIAAINGIPILGHQGEGSITDITIRRLLTLQGTMKPHQIISLMTFDGADNTMSLPDHADHIHVGFHPLFGANTALGAQLNAVLQPEQWTRLIGRLSSIQNPKVRVKPSKYALADG